MLASIPSGEIQFESFYSHHGKHIETSAKSKGLNAKMTFAFASHIIPSKDSV